jgi:GNAT superfamily N-acetyltransferase
MRRMKRRPPKLAVHPLTPARWPDLVKLFGPRGACGGCWCMWWRLSKADFVAGKGDGNRGGLEAYVRSGRTAGLLAYAGGEPVGWVAVEPRDAYPRLARSRTLAAVDDRPVWSITCFYVARAHRGSGVTRALIDAAIRYARAEGAEAVEAYPVAYRGKLGDAFLYTGAASTFLDLGFEEVARRSPTRPIVRKVLRARPGVPLTTRAGGRARAAARASRAR